MLNSHQIFSLIGYANYCSSLLSENLVTSKLQFEDFDYVKGIPLLIPADPALFDYNSEDTFEISFEILVKKIYGLSDINYEGFKHAFDKFKFLSKIRLKTKHHEFLNKIVKQNQDVISYVRTLKSKYRTIGAFQTRNVPHFGHEKIISEMLKNCDHLVINPVVGPKKKGDVRLESLTEIFENLMNEKYMQNVSFFPVYANMYYAGPREAIHHANLRQKLGFDFFSVGRDHAGSGNVYSPEAASKIVNQLRDSLGIEIMQHCGVVFCNRCSKAVFKNECNHVIEQKKDISGSSFRECLKRKEFFPLANRKMQEKIFRSKIRIFEE